MAGYGSSVAAPYSVMNTRWVSPSLTSIGHVNVGYVPTTLPVHRIRLDRRCSQKSPVKPYSLSLGAQVKMVRCPGFTQPCFYREGRVREEDNWLVREGRPRDPRQRPWRATELELLQDFHGEGEKSGNLCPPTRGTRHPGVRWLPSPQDPPVCETGAEWGRGNGAGRGAGELVFITRGFDPTVVFISFLFFDFKFQIFKPNSIYVLNFRCPISNIIQMWI
jgi:hypothetical protein